MMVLLLLLSASGCVFFRLLELRHQLARFDENFTVDTEDGLTLRFLNPVLLEHDLWLLGLPPSVRKVCPTHTTCKHIFEKQAPPGRRRDPRFDLSVSSVFRDGKLTEFAISEAYFAFIPKEALLLTIRSLGRIEVDVENRTASLKVTDDDSIEDFVAPDRQSILQTLGPPTFRKEEGGIRSLDYRFKLLAPVEAEQPVESRHTFRFIFFFAEDDEISRISGTLPFIGEFSIRYD